MFLPRISSKKNSFNLKKNQKRNIYTTDLRQKWLLAESLLDIEATKKGEIRGVSIAQWIAHLLYTQLARVRISAPENFVWCLWVNWPQYPALSVDSGISLIVDRTHPILASGKLVLQKRKEKLLSRKNAFQLNWLFRLRPEQAWHDSSQEHWE